MSAGAQMALLPGQLAVSALRNAAQPTPFRSARTMTTPFIGAPTVTRKDEPNTS
jgi:hypothetical protein